MGWTVPRSALEGGGSRCSSSRRCGREVRSCIRSAFPVGLLFTWRAVGDWSLISYLKARPMGALCFYAFFLFPVVQFGCFSNKLPLPLKNVLLL